MITSTVHALADELLDALFTADPIEPTLFGVPGYDDRLADLSEDGDTAMRERVAGIVERAAAAEPSTVDIEDKVTRAVVETIGRARLVQLDARLVEFTISGLFISPAARLISALPMITLPDADRGRAYLARLRGIPDYLAAAARRHRIGLAAGRAPVRRLVAAAIAQLDGYLSAPDTDPFLREPIADELAAERERVLAEVVRPAFGAYRAVLADEIIHGARSDDRPGICWLPDGQSVYIGLSTVHTTTARTPEELHQTGLEVIAGLTDEYARIGSRMFGTTDRHEIFRRLKTDPQLCWTDADELLAAAVAAVRRAEQAAPRWFGRLPSQPCTVQAMPEAEAPTAAAAKYLMPALDGTRPGIYFANTHQADQRSRFQSEVSAFHEAVPGHHFQMSLAQELTDLPLLRRLIPINAYGEGWGLYTERLADEMGLYSGDLDRLGMLAMDSLRAARLVVDTGLHAKGWTRQQAVDYLRDNTPVAPLEIESEIDRYIAFPGQALSYMVGRLEIQRLRARAEHLLGDRFDPRAFHDAVLGGGSLPMTVLDGVVSDWTRKQVNGRGR